MVRTFMLQHNDGTMILVCGIIGKGKDRSIPRRVDGCAHRNEQIHPEMDGAIFIGRLSASGERGRCVEISRFIISTDADGCACFEDGLLDTRR